MKTLIKNSLILLLCLFLNGCATPLTIIDDGARFSRLFEIHEEDIEILTYGTHAYVKHPQKFTDSYSTGVILVTPSAIYYRSQDDRMEVKKEVVIKYDEIIAVEMWTRGRGRQIQIQIKDGFHILNPTKDTQMVNIDASEDIYKRIVELGVQINHYDIFIAQPPPKYFPIYL